MDYKDIGLIELRAGFGSCEERMSLLVGMVAKLEMVSSDGRMLCDDLRSCQDGSRGRAAA